MKLAIVSWLPVLAILQVSTSSRIALAFRDYGPLAWMCRELYDSAYAADVDA